MTTDYRVQNRVPNFSLTTLYSLTHSLTTVFPRTNIHCKIVQEVDFRGSKLKTFCMPGKKTKQTPSYSKRGNVTIRKCAATHLSQSNPCGILTFGVIIQIPTFQWHYAIFCEVIRGSML